MKKLMCAFLILALCAALSGCQGSRSPEAADTAAPTYAAPDETAVPESYHGEEDQSKALEELPTLEPPEAIDGSEEESGASTDDYYSIDALLEQYTGGEETPDVVVEPESDTYSEPNDSGDQARAAAADPSTYQYSALIDTSLGFTFNYPSHWQNLPGVFTVCFREPVETGDFPARVAISAKKLTHSPEGTVLTDELTSYMKMVYKQYEKNSFEVGTPNPDDTFMGKKAYSNTYLAFKGDTEVKGFVIGRAVKRTLYVFHFCASYEDYASMESMMRYMVNSVELVEQD